MKGIHLIDFGVLDLDPLKIFTRIKDLSVFLREYA